MSLFQKFICLFRPDLEVIQGRPRTDAYLLQFLLFLGLFLFSFLFALIIAEFVEAHYPRDGRLGHRGDFNEIESLFLGQSERVFFAHYAEVLAGLVYYPEFLGDYLIVDSVLDIRMIAGKKEKFNYYKETRVYRKKCALRGASPSLTHFFRYTLVS